MTAPEIQEGLYRAEKRVEYQTTLNKNYEGIESKKGKYPLSLGEEAVYLANGFAYLEYVVLTADINWGNLKGILEEHFGKNNFRLLQSSIPERKLNEENKSSDAFAVYIRTKTEASSAEEKPVKLKIRKESILGTPAI